MPYRKHHFGCFRINCQSYSAYVRAQKKWIKVGEYNSKCKTFTSVENVKIFDNMPGFVFKKTVDHIDYLENMLGIKSKV